MDQCLRMPELLSNIFYHLASPGPVDIIPEHATFPIISRENAKFFADLARTCQAFSEPALDRLWHFQANFTPLFGTLPPGVVYAYKNGIVKLTRKLHAGDYDRVAFYAMRIRILGKPLMGRLGTVDELVLNHFWTSRPKSLPLLPGLLYLKLNLADCVRLCLKARMAMEPSVQAITLYVAEDIYQDPRVDSGDGLPWSNVKTLISQGAPNIKVFKVETDSEYEPLSFGSPSEVLDLYDTFNDLRSLDARSIHQLPCATLTRISTLPKLHSLVISITNTEFAHFLATTSSIEQFPCLKCISFEVEDLEHCSTFFGRQGLSKLESIKITRVERTASHWNLDLFFKQLAKQKTHLSSLTAVHLVSPATDLQGNPHHPANVSVLTPTALKPLFTFTNMDRVHIELNSRVDLDNDFIASIPKAWPKLRMLGLVDNGRDEGVDPKNTLTGLLPLVTSCPYLEELLISVNAQPTLKFSEIGTIVGARNLYILGLGTSPMLDNQSDDIALFLSIAFPCLRRAFGVWPQPWEDDIMSERWRAVYDSLRSIQALQ